MCWTVNGEHIQRSRVLLETRKWLMSKRAPKKYGDKIEQTIAGDADKPIEAVERTYRFVVVRRRGGNNEGAPSRTANICRSLRELDRAKPDGSGVGG